ncbi:LacI family DNA-binding transcriptional regulator [Blastococcus sp. TF02A-30]|uniref:LacI family DNA-binding transcriptional regulator n=1 Tax=Blastococcus sp. TF02A-30 TaxID=2250580 RepID=UPI001F369A5C|nr:LacI family DNA-binding transcriptional regulator [Blastococcus sp. TF02A-30]
MTPRPTLEQVAAHAGVGRGTVSRVVNGSPQVSEQTRRAVEAAIAELGYVPNLAARALVTRRTGTVALVVAEGEERLFEEPFFARAVRGISSAVQASGRQLVLALSEGRPLERYLTPQHVDGVLLLSVRADDPLPRQLQGTGLPVVLGGRPDGVDVPHVDVDNAGGARAAVAHLLATGRRRIATVTGPPDMGAGRDRLAGYRDALAGAEALEVTGDFTEGSGYRGVRELLDRRPDLDAVFAAGDSMAVGALRALREAGRSVPGDVAVVGFDDSPLAAVTDPPLTTVRQPVEELGRAMAELLAALLAGEEPASRVLPTELVVRASS